MIRKIIEINKELCNGCGACAAACHEGAIAMVDGKAALLRDDYCDGLGDCLPTCPTGAIRFVEREAAAYDEAAVLKNKAKALKNSAPVQAGAPCVCAGSQAQTLRHDAPAAPVEPTTGLPSRPSETVVMGKGDARERAELSAQREASGLCGDAVSHLMQWPVQIKLLPVEAPYYQGAKLLIAADCSAFARRDFHQRFMKGRITMIGCPKLDAGDYAEKLTEIIRRNDIREVTILRMEVPCCGGLQRAVETALRQSGRFIPWQVVTLGRDGNIRGSH